MTTPSCTREGFVTHTLPLSRLTLPSLTGIKRQQNNDDGKDICTIVKDGITVPVDHALALASAIDTTVSSAFILICRQRPLQLWILTKPLTMLPTHAHAGMAVIGIIAEEGSDQDVWLETLSDPNNILWLAHPDWDNQHAVNPSLVVPLGNGPSDLLARCEELDDQIREKLDAVLEAQQEIEDGISMIEDARKAFSTAIESNCPDVVRLQGLELDDLNGNLSVIAKCYHLEDQLPLHPDIFKLWVIDRWMHQPQRQPGPPSVEDLLSVFDYCLKAAHNAGYESLVLKARSAEARLLQQLAEVLAIPVGYSLETKLMRLPAESEELRSKARTILEAADEGRLASPDNRRLFCEHLSTDIKRVTLF